MNSVRPSAARARQALEFHLAEYTDLEDALREAEPFHRSFSRHARSRPGRPARHRLIRLVEAVEADLAATRGGHGITHLEDLVELRQAVATLKGWRASPAARSLATHIRDADTYAHNVLVLAAARLLRSWGNLFQPVPAATTPGVPSPDLRMSVGAHVASAEVKAPRELKAGEPIDEATAATLAARARKDSRTQRKDDAALIVLAGYRVPLQALDILARALGAELARSASTNILGGVVFTMGRNLTDIELTVPSARPRTGSIFDRLAATLNPALFQIGIAARTALNERYAGPIPLIRYGSGIHGSGVVLPVS